MFDSRWRTGRVLHASPKGPARERLPRSLAEPSGLGLAAMANTIEEAEEVAKPTLRYTADRRSSLSKTKLTLAGPGRAQV
jgi:hypothetical protein